MKSKSGRRGSGFLTVRERSRVVCRAMGAVPLGYSGRQPRITPSPKQQHEQIVARFAPVAEESVTEILAGAGAIFVLIP